MRDGADLGHGEGFDGEEAADDQDGEGVNVISEESVGCEFRSRWKGITYVALIPPTKVYTTTPIGNKNVAAMMFIPVRAVIAADAPSNMFATANKLFTKQRNMKTKCATVPISC